MSAIHLALMAFGSRSLLQLQDPTNDTDIVVNPSSAQAGITLQSDGDVITVSNGADVYDWMVPKSLAPEDVQCRLSTISGTLSTGTADTWLALTSSRSFQCSQSGIGIKTFVGTLELRRGTGATEVSVSCTITAQVEA